MKRLLAACLCATSLFSSCALFSGSMTRDELLAEYLSLGDAYASVSKYEKAIEYYSKASVKKEYRNVTRYNIGRMYGLSGKWAEAAKTFGELRELEPENTLISTAYAYALVASGDAEGAKPIYEENYNRAPDDPAANRNYAEILVLTKRYPEAIEMITRIKDSFPDTDAAKGIDDLSKKIEDAKKAEAEAEKKEAEGDGKTENGDVKIPSEITAPTKEETPAPRAE